MHSKQELFREAQRQIAFRRQQASMQAAELEVQARTAIPQLEAAENEIRRFGFEAARLAATGAGQDVYAQSLEKVRAARQARNQLLQQHGYAPDQLAPRPVCPICKDSGVFEGRPCRCVLKLCRQMRRQEILEATALNISDFSSLDTRFYPDVFDPELGMSVRQYMTDLLASLKEYAESFDMKSSNLLIVGNAGLGKTHAALAVAGTVLENGYDVIYTSAEELFGHLEKARFDEDDTMLEAVLEADLFILDDLGTEYASAYMLSCFYTILNTRLSAGRPTIYTSNIIDGKLFEKRYTEKIASRLGGSCEVVEFRGEDIRQLKKQSAD